MLRKGSNSVQIRHYNERVVLAALRRLGEASKADLARAANLTPQAIAGIVDALVGAGLIEARGKRLGQVGQPSTMYAAAPDGAFSIGLHIGRRAFDAVLVDFAGRTRKIESCAYGHPEPEQIAELAGAYIRTLQSSLPPESRRKVIGVGVAIPYFLGGWASELGLPARVCKAWEDFDLRARLAAETRLPLHFENDASSAAAAELVYGIGREIRDFIYLSIHTFIGGGLIIDGNLETGPHGNSAAFGPYPVGPSRLSTVPPPAGPFEILLRRASIYVLTNHLRANGVPIMRASELEGLGEGAEPYLSEWIEDCADALAQAVIGAISVVDVSAIVIDGILPRPILERTLLAIRTRLAAIMPEGLILPKILSGTIGAQAAAIGAAIIPLYAMFAPDSDVLVKPDRSEPRPSRIGAQADALIGSQ